MTLLNKTVMNEPWQEQQFSSNYIELKKATVDDSLPLIEFLKDYDEVSLCDWQNENSMKLGLSSENFCCYIATFRGAIVGAIIGGIIGTRATINHLAVHIQFRKNGLGRKLVKSAKDEFSRLGIKRVFLFVSNKNDAALAFWNKQCFVATSGETTMETDL